MIIYLLAKIWQECKQRRNSVVVVAPLNIVYHPCFNNLQFNPIIVKSKTFLIYSISCILLIIVSFILYELKLIEMYSKYNEVQGILLNFYLSIIFPLNIYLKNPSLRKYLWNDLLNDLCLWIVLTVFQYWNKNLKIVNLYQSLFWIVL